MKKTMSASHSFRTEACRKTHAVSSAQPTHLRDFTRLHHSKKAIIRFLDRSLPLFLCHWSLCARQQPIASRRTFLQQRFSSLNYTSDYNPNI
jgi:hypothetical protein